MGGGGSYFLAWHWNQRKCQKNTPRLRRVLFGGKKYVAGGPFRTCFPTSNRPSQWIATVGSLRISLTRHTHTHTRYMHQLPISPTVEQPVYKRCFWIGTDSAGDCFFKHTITQSHCHSLYPVDGLLHANISGWLYSGWMIQQETILQYQNMTAFLFTQTWENFEIQPNCGSHG